MRNILFILLASVLFSCEEVYQTDENTSIPVVRAFIRTDDPVDDIYLSLVEPLGSDSSSSVITINDAQPKIVWNTLEYPLIPTVEKPGYYHYDGNDLAIDVGQVYRLEFEYNGQTVYGSTQIEEPPTNVRIEFDSLSVRQIQTEIERIFLQAFAQMVIPITWEGNEGDYYFITIELLEEEPKLIDLTNILPDPGIFVSPPFQDREFILRPVLEFRHFGVHSIRVYSVGQDYAFMYETLDQDSRNLSEPYSNITNGVGIFAGFSYTEILFNVIELPR